MPGRAVSVVIPTRDRPHFLAQALRSALGQRDVDVEVIVVDDGSAEGVVQGVLPRLDDRVRLLRHDRSRGVSEARNAGIGAASAEWVAFLDDDDLWAPEKLAAQLDALAAAPECGWSSVGAVVVDAELKVIGWSTPPAERDVALDLLVDNVIWSPSGVIVSRDLLTTAGLFDPALACCADWDLFLRLAQRSPLASVHRPLIAYRVHPFSMTVDLDACTREMELLSERYASLRAPHGATVDRVGWEHWKAATHLRAGRRWRSLQALRAAVELDHDWRRFARGATMTALPGAVRLRDLRQRRRVPQVWRTEAQAWLAQVQPVTSL